MIALIVVIAENNAIGKNGDLLCHLPADLKHFKEITMGHTIIMGRKTFDSLPKGALPGRTNVVITRNKDFSADNTEVFHSIEEALANSQNQDLRFIIGGAEIYKSTLPFCDTLYLTKVKASFPDADTFFPEINMEEWDIVSQQDNKADEKNPYDYSFVTLKRN